MIGDHEAVEIAGAPPLARGFHRGPSGSLYVFTTTRAFAIRGRTVVEVGRVLDPSVSQLVSVSEDGAGVLWGTTAAGGLMRLSGPAPRALRIADGMYSDRLRHVLFDDRDWAWFSSPDGVFRVARPDLDRGSVVSVVERATAELVVGGVNARYPAAARTRDGRLHFATARGLLVFEPGRREAPRAVRPVIDRVTVDGRTVAPTSTIHIPRGSRVAFAFTAPAMEAPAEVRFRSRLRGLESSWVDIGGERVVSYIGLPAGEHRFELEARAGAGSWMGVERPVLLHVPPPLHTRPWFVALSLAAIGAASLAAHRMRLARARQRFEAVLDERNRIARDVHDTLAQSLVAVSVQIETIRAAVGADPETLTERLDRASQAIDAGVEGARRSVRALRSPDPGMNRLESELRNAAALLSGNTPVHVTVTGRTRPLPSSVEEHLLRIGQEALTNAVRHARARSVQVRLHFSDAPRSRWRRVLPGARWAPRPVTLTVSDDGVGFDADVATPGRGLGLVGLRERARELGARLTIDSRPGRGTVVQVELTI